MNTNSVVDNMISYMNEKYDDTFTYVAPFGGGAGANSKQIIVKSEKYPDYDIWVEYSYKTEKYSDNYTDYKYKKDVEEYFEKKFENVLNKKTKVVYSVVSSGCYDDYPADVTFEEYVNNIEQHFMLGIAVNGFEAEKEAVEQATIDVLKKHESSFWAKVYLVADSDECETFLDSGITKTDGTEYLDVDKEKGAVVPVCEWR